MTLDELIAERVRTEVSRQLGALAATAQSERITVRTAAEVADAAAATVRRWVREGHVEATGEGKRLRISRASLEAFLASPRRKAVPMSELSPEALADIYLARGR